MAAPVYGIQDPYLANIDPSTSEHVKLYKKSIFGLPESESCDLTRSKWTDFYQQLEDDVSTFGFKSAVLIVTSRVAGHAPTEVKTIILSYPSITQVIVDSHYEILWADNSGANLGCHPKANYAAGLYDADKQAVISQQRLIPKMIGLWINNYLTTNAKRKWRYFKSAYTLNAQDNGAEIFLVIVKMVRPDTCAGCSYIKSKLENMKMYHFKHDIPEANLKIVEWMNDITIAGKTYSKFQKWHT